MKSKTIAFLTALLMTVLTGCNTTPPNEEKPQPFSFSERSQSAYESEAPVTDDEIEQETTPKAVQGAETENQEKKTGKGYGRP